MCGRRSGISIHAPLAGRDWLRKKEDKPVSISIHAPLAGRDHTGNFIRREVCDFNPRAPCGARLDMWPSSVVAAMISIHAPLAGRDWAP